MIRRAVVRGRARDPEEVARGHSLEPAGGSPVPGPVARIAAAPLPVVPLIELSASEPEQQSPVSVASGSAAGF